jgi:hypothetical protein
LSKKEKGHLKQATMKRYKIDTFEKKFVQVEVDTQTTKHELLHSLNEVWH